MDTVTDRCGETGRRAMDTPAENYWCWTWDGAVEMERSRQIVDVLRR